MLAPRNSSTWNNEFYEQFLVFNLCAKASYQVIELIEGAVVEDQLSLALLAAGSDLYPHSKLLADGLFQVQNVSGWVVCCACLRG